MNHLSKVLLKCVSIANQPSQAKILYKIESFPSLPTQLPPLKPANYRFVAPEPRVLYKTNKVFQKTWEKNFLTAQTTQEHIVKTPDFAKGLPNLGNTCFIASVIQASLVFQKAAFVEKMKTATEDEKKTIQQFIDWITDYENSKSVSLSPLLGILTQNGVYNGSQEDAAELMTWLRNYQSTPTVSFEQIAEFDPEALKPGEFMIPAEENPAQFIQEIALEVESEVGPYGGRKIKSGQNLVDLIKKFFSKVDMKDQNSYLERYVLDTEGQMSERKLPILSRREVMSAAPQELTFQLKKYSRDRDTGSTFRLDGALEEVPETFILPEDCCANGEVATYRLRSVISHHGISPDSGHYTAYVRKGDSYVCANDSVISQIDRETMLKAAKEGYILIYDKVTQN